MAAGRVCLVAQGRGDLLNHRDRRVFHRRQRENGLPADLRPGILLQFLSQRGHGCRGSGPDLAQRQTRPIVVGRAVVLQGLDQPRHGLGAGLGDRVENAEPDARVRIFQELDAQRHGDLRSRADVHHRLDRLAADRLVGVLQQVDQGGNGRLGRRADRAQRPGGVGADLGRAVFEQFRQRGDGLRGLRAPLAQLVDGLQPDRLVGRLQVGHQRGQRLIGRLQDGTGQHQASQYGPKQGYSFSDSCSDSYGKMICYYISVLVAA